MELFQISWVNPIGRLVHTILPKKDLDSLFQGWENGCVCKWTIKLK